MCARVQTELRPENTSARSAGIHRDNLASSRLSRGVIQCVALAAGIYGVLHCSSSHAEEQAESAASRSTLFELSTPLSSRWLIPSLLSEPVAEADSQSRNATLWPEDKFACEIVARATPRRQVLVERSLQLLHARMPSHFAYDGWANLQTG